MGWVLGIDIGSVCAKAIGFNGHICHYGVEATGWNPRETGRKLIQQLSAQMGELPDKIISTGYGRKLVGEADYALTELTCHARGARFLMPSSNFLLDIGGQDSKVVSLDQKGNIIDFCMNDRCAAGTGRFVQMVAGALGYDMDEMINLNLNVEVKTLSSTCAVFAETEVVSLLSQGVNRQSLALGVLESIANRSANMIKRMGGKGNIFFSGGLSRSTTLRSLLEKQLGLKFATHELAQWCGALGAAVAGYEGDKNVNSSCS